MAPIVYLLVKIGFLVLLWIFVFAALQTVRSDLFGMRPDRRPPAGTFRSRNPKSARPKKGARVARTLIVMEGSLAGTKLKLGTAAITIGRAPDSTLVLTDDFVSTHHARFVPRGEQWLVEDMGSTNGTYLDREKVSGPTLVDISTPVRIGKTVVELRA